MTDNKIIHDALASSGILDQDKSYQARITFLGSGLFEVYRVDSGNISVAAKLISNIENAESEMDGLTALEKAGARVPHPIHLHVQNNTAVILMDLIESGGKMRVDECIQDLLRLYTSPADQFGYHRINFCGTQKQKNSWTSTFMDFWWNCRIKLQMELAINERLLSTKHLMRAEKIVRNCCEKWGYGNVRPRLIHGDLWSGNVLFDRDGKIVLIDPAVSYAHPEQDLAMLELFGSPIPNKALDEISAALGFPDRKERVPFFQLYPLLIHVNIFGSGYVAGVERCISIYE